jgi:hypothetical protein
MRSASAVAAHPELTGRRPEVERGRLQLVDVHRIALDGKEALFFRQPSRDAAPRSDLLVLCHPGAVDVRVQVGFQIVMGGHLVAPAALFVQPHPVNSILIPARRCFTKGAASRVCSVST